MRKEALENYEKYLERVNLYNSFGYDIKKERSFIMEKSRPLQGSILEVGTGKGYFAIELASQGFHFTSVDISETEQNFARLNIEYLGLQDLVRFQIGNAESLSFQDKSFDIIFCSNTLHHLAHPFKAVDEMIRVVSSQGKIVLSDFSQQGFAMIDNILSAEGRKHDVSAITLENIASYLSNKGLNIAKYQTILQEVLVVSE